MMSFRCLLVFLLGWFFLPAGRSFALTNGNFEATPFSTGWTVTGVPAAGPGLVAGSAQAARFTAVGQALSQPVAWGGDWYVDAYFAVKAAAARQFSLIIYNGTNSIVNVRYEAGAWATFNGTAFVSEPALGTLAASVDANADGDLDDAGDTKNIYRMRLTGRGFGTAAAVYDLRVSDANGTAFTRTVAGMTRWQSVSGTAATPNSIRFGSEFGNNPGWWLDEVTQHVEGPPPGPVALPYAESFAAASHRFTAGADWSVVGGAYRNTITASAVASAASFLTDDLSGVNPPGFFLSSKFTVVSQTTTGNAVGFALFGTNATFSGGVNLPYYLVDFRPGANVLRFLRVGVNNTSFLPDTTLATMSVNTAQPFALEVLGRYEFGALEMNLVVRQGALSETYYVVDSEPLSVGFFGYRNRTGTGGALTVDCDDFTLRRVSTAAFTATPAPFARPGVAYSSPVAAASNIGASVTLSAPMLPPWLTLSGGVLSGTPPAPGSHAVTLLATDSEGGFVEQTFNIAVLSATGVLISEFLAENDSGLRDEDGDQSDWVELFNSADSPADVSGWWLSDDPALPMKWAIPAGTTIPARGFLVVFASGKNRATPQLHTNFKLSNATDASLVLSMPNGTGHSSYLSYPSQRADHSYGTYGSYATSGYLITPTPGAPNDAAGYAGFVADTQFSVLRGFYASPQTVVVNCATPGATIVYTTNGSTPSLANGTPSAPPLTLNIASTTTLRVAAFAPNLIPTGTDTASYFFLEDIRQQPVTPPAGWPEGPVNGQVLQYGMDPDITVTVTAQQMKDALAALPTLSLTTDLPNLFDPATGIYVNPYGREEGYECPVSVELLNADNTPGFFINAGLRIRGGFSRQGTNPKHNFHLYFRGEYGAAKLKFPLFGDEGTDEFDRVDLRSTQVRSWHNGGDTSATFNRDEWNRLTHGAMGQPYTRSRYYHLYINGQYWGLYGTQERADADYAASYFGGQKENYDVMKTYVIPHRVEAADGDNAAWSQLYNAAVAGFGTDAAYFAAQGRDSTGTPTGSQPLLDVDSLIDFTALHYYNGDDDAPVNTGVGSGVPKNFYAIRPRAGTWGFRFLTHDAESTMVDGRNVTGIITAGSTLPYFNPRWLSQQLEANAKYRLRFADRVQKHWFNGGALDTPKGIARWHGLRAEINTAILGESARWGDAASATPRTVANFNTANDAIETGFLVTRRAVFISQLRARNLFPGVDAPAFSQHGGNVPAGFTLGITAPPGSTTFYTTDQTDPSGPAALAYTAPIVLTGTQVTVKARGKLTATGEWSALTEAVFNLAAVPAASGLLAISEIHYNPPGPGDDTEFVELQNTSASRLDLTGIHFTGAMIFTCGSLVLEPGARILVVENAGAFITAYGPGPVVAGQWSGALNNGGDSVTLLDASGAVIETVAYDDAPPWPTAPDGDGPSLVRINTAAPPLPENWRASALPGGHPGTTDTTNLTTWLAARGLTATADPDANGLSAAMEFALGLDLPAPAGTPLVPEIIPASAAPPVIQWSARIGATGFSVLPETSADLQTWLPSTAPVAYTWTGSGREIQSLTLPLGAPRHYFRLRVTVP